LNRKVNEGKPVFLGLGIMYFSPRGERDQMSNPSGGCRLRLFRLEELNRCAVEKKIGAKGRFFIEPHSIWCYSASVAEFWQLAREVPRLKPHRIIFSVRTAALFFMRQSKIE